MEFVTESLSLATGLSTSPSPSSQTWKSVVEQQVDLVKKSNLKANSLGTGVPFWVLAEVAEVYILCLELIEFGLMIASSLPRKTCCGHTLAPFKNLAFVLVL